MMPSERQIEAYRKRLARIVEKRRGLTVECLNAVATVVDEDQVEATGTLVAYRHRLAVGLFGTYVATDVTLCPKCVDTPNGECPRVEDLPEHRGVTLTHLRRNGDDQPTEG